MTTKTTKAKTPRLAASDEEVGISVQALLMHHAQALKYVDWSTDGDANWQHNRALKSILWLLGIDMDKKPDLEDLNRQYGKRKAPVRVTGS